MLIKEIMCQKRNENLVQENDMYNKIYGYYLVFIIYSSKIFYERNNFYNYTTQQNRANFDMILIITRLREKLFLRTTSDLSLLPTREKRNSLKSHLLLFLSEKSILTIARVVPIHYVHAKESETHASTTDLFFMAITLNINRNERLSSLLARLL